MDNFGFTIRNASEEGTTLVKERIIILQERLERIQEKIKYQEGKMRKKFSREEKKIKERKPRTLYEDWKRERIWWIKETEPPRKEYFYPFKLLVLRFKAEAIILEIEHLDSLIKKKVNLADKHVTLDGKRDLLRKEVILCREIMDSVQDEELLTRDREAKRHLVIRIEMVQDYRLRRLR